MAIKITLFESHGFKKIKDSGGQIVGLCPFCRKEKFYINAENGKWDCKVCGISGGFQSFITEIYAKLLKVFDKKHLAVLAKDRGLKTSTLENCGVVYNVASGRYNIPIKNPDNTLADLRSYRIGGKLMSSIGAQNFLFNFDRLQSDGPIWLCEGEWDAMALMECLTEANILGVPGASTFKDSWGSFFQNREVSVLYDNDEAGNVGARRVFNKIGQIAKLKFVHWPKTFNDGFDIRDLYVKHFSKNAKATIDFIHKHLDALPQGTGRDVSIKASKQETPSVSPDEIKSAYTEWLYLPDKEVIDVLFGTILANRLPGDPIWLFLIAPPGGTKSELLMSLNDAADIYPTTSLTSHSLVSGANLMGGADPSLVPRLNNKILVVKDFTTILSMPEWERNAIFGILRDVYDGRIEWQFGNGVIRRYQSKFGIIAGVTPMIEMFTETTSALGERFLSYWIQNDNHKSTIMQAMKNVTQEVEMRADLQLAAKKVLNAKYDVISKDLSPEIYEMVANMASVVAKLRSSIQRDRYTKEITHKPFSEIGTRLAKQFIKLLLGIAMFNRREICANDIMILKKIVRGSVPQKYIAYLKFENEFTVKKVCGQEKINRSFAVRSLENLRALGIVKRLEGIKADDTYIVEPEFREMLSFSGVV